MFFRAKIVRVEKKWGKKEKNNREDRVGGGEEHSVGSQLQNHI